MGNSTKKTKHRLPRHRKKHVLAVIPARGGSKGIPKKNIISFLGKPLLAWSVEAACHSKYVTRTIVSSDSLEILKVGKDFGAESIKRPDHLSTDDICSDVAALHALEFLEEREGYKADIVILLQPTSPLRTAEDIDIAVELLESSGAGAVISVYEVDNKHLKTFFIDERQYLRGIVNNEFPFMSRQYLPKIYMPNGSIYVIHTEELIKNKKFFSEKAAPYIMDSRRSIDIDSPEDIAIAEELLRKILSSK